MDSLHSLFRAAAAARAHSYAPYSGFAVGAAIRGVGGGLYCGTNVENAAYPLGICAESSAIAAMVLAGERAIAEILVVADSAVPVTPCGGCRQRLLEFGSPQTKVHVAGLEGWRASYALAALLPEAFGPKTLDSAKG
jgi:cytidine deaminase